MKHSASDSPAELNTKITRTPACHVAMVSVHGDPSAPIGTEGAGGQNVYVRELSKALHAAGNRVTVFTRGAHGDGTPEALDLDGVTVVRVPCGFAGPVARGELFRHLPEFVARAAAWAEANEAIPSVLHSHYWLSGWVGMALVRRWGLPHVHTPHSLGAVKASAMAANGLDPVRLQVEDEIAAQATALIATTPADVEARARHYKEQGRAEVISCGYDPEVFHPGNRSLARGRWGLPLDAPVLGYVGRFDPGKGLDTLMYAFDRVAESTDARLVLAGGYRPGGPDEREHERWRAWVASRPWHGRVHWLGRLDAAEVADVYRAATLIVVPSRYESFGMVALEAMACGTPVVASAVGGLQHVVQHEKTGLLTPPDDPAALADACRSLLQNPNVWLRASALAQEAASHHTWPRIGRAVEMLYARCREQVTA